MFLLITQGLLSGASELTAVVPPVVQGSGGTLNLRQLSWRESQKQARNKKTLALPQVEKEPVESTAMALALSAALTVPVAEFAQGLVKAREGSLKPVKARVGPSIAPQDQLVTEALAQIEQSRFEADAAIAKMMRDNNNRAAILMALLME